MGQNTAVAEGASTPAVSGLEQNYPNPFNPRTTIAYQVGNAGSAALVLYDAAGQKVRTLVQAQQGPGRYQVQWDGHTDGGQQAASGVYFYRLQAGEYREVRRLVLLR